MSAKHAVTYYSPVQVLFPGLTSGSRCSGSMITDLMELSESRVKVHSPPRCQISTGSFRECVFPLLSVISKGTGMAIFSRFSMVIKRSEEHTSELQSLMRITYAVFCLKKKQPY